MTALISHMIMRPYIHAYVLWFSWYYNDGLIHVHTHVYVVMIIDFRNTNALMVKLSSE